MSLVGVPRVSQEVSLGKTGSNASQDQHINDTFDTSEPRMCPVNVPFCVPVWEARRRIYLVPAVGRLLEEPSSRCRKRHLQGGQKRHF